MTKRISDLSLDQLKIEASHAWSEAASRALKAGLKIEGVVRPSHGDEASQKTPPRKAGKKGVRAA